ncbi:acyltransferase family protein [uncultured Serinicoccus sp.]|uniref:acyltransferase family protein n=1 Tax=uncultured Serinicoccus sp. TaxID=735514 RepID=UPI00260C9B1E|nr:acyltransferase family protein [uncultured Serinicoccus sp.]
MPRPDPTTARGRGRRQDIEGLRAVAVIAVLLYHLRVPGLGGGFAGVDVFFVISGFLITGILLREIDRTGRVSLGDFWARRARRLLPAALVVVAATFAASWVVLPTSSRPDLLADVLGSTLYVVNWVLAARSVDYLAEGAGVSPLQHYWSLAVEEQFYLLWPLLVVVGLALAARTGTSPRRPLAVVLGLVTALSLGWSVVATAQSPQTAYLITPTRLWELSAGALLAFTVPALRRLPARAAQVAAAAGLALVLLTVLAVGPGTPWPGSAALLPVVGSALILAAGTSGTPTLVGRLLSVPPMVWVGGLSYGIYLVHWPLLVLVEEQRGPLGPAGLVLIGVLTVLLAWLLRLLVEDPVRYSTRLGVHPARSLLAAATAMALVTGVAGVAWAARPTLGATTAPGPAALVADATAEVWEPVGLPRRAYDRAGPVQPDPSLAREDVPGYYADGCQVQPGVAVPDPTCVYGDVDAPTRVALWGDSKLGQYASALEAIAQAESWRLELYLKSACSPTVSGATEPECDAFGQEVVRQLLADPPHLVLLGSGGFEAAERSGMVEGARALTDAGIDVVVVDDNAHPDHQAYECAAEHPEDLLACERPPRGIFRRPHLRAVHEATGAPVIDLNPWICPEETTCPAALGGQLVYRQGSHLTDTYARSLTPFLYRELSALGLTEAAPGDIALDDVPRQPSGGRR